MRQVNGVQGGYKVGTWGARWVQDRYKACEVGTRQVKGVQGRNKAGKRGAWQV